MRPGRHKYLLSLVERDDLSVSTRARLDEPACVARHGGKTKQTRREKKTNTAREGEGEGVAVAVAGSVRGGSVRGGEGVRHLIDMQRGSEGRRGQNSRGEGAAH